MISRPTLYLAASKGRPWSRSRRRRIERWSCERPQRGNGRGFVSHPTPNVNRSGRRWCLSLKSEEQFFATNRRLGWISRAMKGRYRPKAADHGDWRERPLSDRKPVAELRRSVRFLSPTNRLEQASPSYRRHARIASSDACRARFSKLRDSQRASCPYLHGNLG